MLSYLRVRNLALLEELDLAFRPGLTVVTGDTGAGKSMILAALQLVLGARARPELVRAGEARAEVEALFDVRGDEAARARMLAFGLEGEEEIAVRRVVEAEGRARAWINGRLATAGQLAELARGLVDLSSQHEHHSLVDAATHLGFLDAFAGLAGPRREMGAAWEQLMAIDADLARLESAGDEARIDLLRYQLGELERGAAGPEEEAEAARLRHAEVLQRGCARVEGVLCGEEGAVASALGRAAVELGQAARLDASLEPMLQQLDLALAEVEDVGRALGRYRERVHADPERLAALEERLHDARRLRRKYGEDLVAARDRVRAELAESDGVEERRAELRHQREEAQLRVSDAAAVLAGRRREAAERLGAAITLELGHLGMAEARLRVEVAAAPMGPLGADRVEMVIAANRGEAAHPLRRVASGGELSRALLAIKRVLARLGPVGLYVFDEVDSGVGGAVAEAIGRTLADVADHHQVLCITHAPQIAAWGTQHLHVAKEVAGGRTRSVVRELDPAARLEEIARMLGGRKVGNAARAAAKELLAMAA